LDIEAQVPFHEHIFLEPNIENWCPKRGPIRHFMELVCVGLSKNPYLTVQEKKDHIEWYHEYFKGKNSIIEQIGGLEQIK
jgi:small subunit ribosomal protein S31